MTGLTRLHISQAYPLLSMRYLFLLTAYWSIGVEFFAGLLAQFCCWLRYT